MNIAYFVNTNGSYSSSRVSPLHRWISNPDASARSSTSYAVTPGDYPSRPASDPISLNPHPLPPNWLRFVKSPRLCASASKTHRR